MTKQKVKLADDERDISEGDILYTFGNIEDGAIECVFQGVDVYKAIHISGEKLALPADELYFDHDRCIEDQIALLFTKRKNRVSMHSLLNIVNHYTELLREEIEVLKARVKIYKEKLD